MKMNMVFRFFSVFVFIAVLWGSAKAQSGEYFDWEFGPELAEMEGSGHAGLAGAFAGVSNGAVIIGGGTNFPDNMPWQGGEKVWYDKVYVLRSVSDGQREWFTAPEFKLPRPLAYGVGLSYGEKMICIGGCDAERVYDDVFSIYWSDDSEQIIIEQMPSLPVGLAYMSGAVINDRIYIAGGQDSMKKSFSTKHFFCLDMSTVDSGGTWEVAESWPGPSRKLAVSASQSDGMYDCFYLFSGIESGSSGSRALTDGYVYSPREGSWSRISDVGISGGEALCVAGAGAVACGANHILVFGGDDRSYARRVDEIIEEHESLEQQARQAEDPAIRQRLMRQALEKQTQKNRMLENHPGFSREIFAYHTITDTWAQLGQMDSQLPVTTSAVRLHDDIYILAGEVRPGVRTSNVIVGSVSSPKKFGTVNYLVILAYLGVLVWMGFYFSKREHSTNDFFKAGGRIPWWAAGLSIFGTQLSAITFMAIPAKTYATDWRYLPGNLMPVVIAPLIIFTFLPFFRRLDVTTAYEYLERRFNLGARLLGSITFIILQIGRIGIVLFLPSIALSVVTGIDVRMCILVMGVLSIIYTVLGGIEAVVWTDVLQVIILVGGALICVIIILMNIEGGVFELFSQAARAGKMKTFDFRFNFTAPTLWVLLLGGLFQNVISYGSDQTVVQRYLTTRDEKSAANSLWASAIATIPSSFLFFTAGTCLYVFYKAHPEGLNPAISNSDAIFPWFIVSRLPAGLGGLLIAAIFAAAMSSLDSSMNSVATAITTDFYRRFAGAVRDEKCLFIARLVTVIVGAAGTVLALLMSGWQIRSLWDQITMVVGLFAGGLGGLFVLGIFFKRANGIGAIVGLLSSGLVQFIVKEYTPLFLMLYPFTGVLACVVIGYAASLLTPFVKKDLEGLTLGTVLKKQGVK